MNALFLTQRHATFRSLILSAIFGTLAAILMSFEISIPLMPAFIKMDFSEIPVILSALILGFPCGMITAVVKVVLKFLISGTSTMFIGELVNIIISILYILPFCMIRGLIRKKDRTILALIAATVFCSITAVFMNYLVIFPMYAKLFSINADDIIQMFARINPLVKNSLTMLLFSLIPFNLSKYGLDSLLSWMIYKRLGVFR